MNKQDIGILVVDDELIVRESLTKWFREDGFRVDAAENGAAALRKLQGNSWNIMLVDIKMPGMDGIELLQRIREITKEITVIIITAFASVDSAVKALKEGAYDYITKPIDPDYLDHLIEKALKEQQLVRENRQLRDTVSELSTAGEIIGDSPEIRNVMELIHTVAPTDTTVMIRGESGTGKELVARAIHNGSPRRYFPIVTVNCGGMTETLLESELFGHERGAFTGAQQRRKGKVELADGGTLFLDEIGNIDMKTQMDLLRVIETKQFTRVGGTDIIRSDFRVICATNKDLEQAVKDGIFREDLFYRLNVFTVCLPPLRKRPGDIAQLAHYFLEKYTRAMTKTVKSFTPEAMHALKGYDWPGNVRELENAVERAVVVCKGPSIEKDDLPVQTVAAPRPDGRKLEDIEHRYIAEVLDETGWNITRSASILDIDRVTLYHKIEKFGLKRKQ
ncbi:MAG: sigma-54-dependent Fis family transcriptional regulator [Ignavibacteriae bacterium]|nr:sigma-54-dependent Fis family transcriptional regulator [Ignavibacteriota bacterium]